MKRNEVRVIKKIGIILISLLLVLALTNQVFAYTIPGTSITIGDPITDPDYYKPDSPTEASGATKLQTIGNTIVGIVQVIGTVLSVAVLAVIGIKYMVGSVEERAEYKKTLMPYIIGAVLVFGITNILGIIVKVAGLLF